MKKLYFPIVLSIFISLSSCAQDKPNQVEDPKEDLFEVQEVVTELVSPWGLVFLNDESLLITERSGKLILFKEGIKKELALPFDDIWAKGQGGLLDLELHPDYYNNGWIYMSYSSSSGEGEGAHTAIVRFKIEDNKIVQHELLYKGSPNVKTAHHFGSRIEFDDKGYLYFSIGERGEREVNPQDIHRDGGKIYRLNDDGSIPVDNPFVNTQGAKKAIFSYGHRNPQGLFFHPIRRELWEHEHGPRGGDEINIIKKGANYGWPIITYGINYSGTAITDITAKKGMEQPVHYWVPSIAPSGVLYVTSDRYPKWKGNLLVGSLSFQYLERLVLADTKVTYREKLLGGIGRVRTIRQGPDGFIYVGVEGKGILKLLPKP